MNLCLNYRRFEPSMQHLIVWVWVYLTDSALFTTCFTRFWAGIHCKLVTKFWTVLAITLRDSWLLEVGAELFIAEMDIVFWYRLEVGVISLQFFSFFLELKIVQIFSVRFVPMSCPMSRSLLEMLFFVFRSLFSFNSLLLCIHLCINVTGRIRVWMDCYAFN